MVIRRNSSGTSSQDSPHCSSDTKSKSSCLKISDPSEFKGRIIFMSVFNDISWRSEDNEQECNANADLVSIHARKFLPGRWSFLGPGSEKMWYSAHGSRPQGEWDRVAELMMIKFGESVNTTPHPSYFYIEYMRTRMAQVWVRTHSSHPCVMFHAHCGRRV